MYKIQNRMKRTWIVPATFKEHNAIAFEHVNLAPGASALVSVEHWDEVKKGNQVIEALLTERHLVVTKAGKEVRDLSADELANPKSPTAPEELTEKDDRVTIESKVEIKEVELKDDAPAEGKSKAK